MSASTPIPDGVGLNLRLRYLDTILERRPAEAAFWEVIAENLFDRPQALERVKTIRHHRPIALHCVGMNLAGTDPISKPYLTRIRHLIAELDPFLVSDHLCWQTHGNISHHDLLPFPLTATNTRHVAARIHTVQEILGRPIAIENLTTYVAFRTSTEREEDLLNTLASATGCGVILDLNNIALNAHNLGQSDTHRYLERLDLRHVVEVHIAGPEPTPDGVLIDTHSSLPTPLQLDLVTQHPILRTLPVCYERDQQLPPLEESLKLVDRLNLRRTSMQQEAV
ncbi:MAG: DUF692 domain-containing protein [Myxococcota bacterium]